MDTRFGVARFSDQEAAGSMRDFMNQGMEDEVQSINVVPYPDGQEAQP